MHRRDVIDVLEETTRSAAELVSEAAWNCDWVGAPISFQRCIAFIIAIANKKMVLTAGKCVPVSKETMMSYQFAYLPGKSTEAALHHVVSPIEKVLAFKEIAIEACLDIEGVFDKTSCEVVSEALQKHKVPAFICRWIHFMLENRQITMCLFGKTLKVTTARGYPQGGVLSPLLWNLVVDAFLRELNGAGYFIIGFADDIAVIVKGKFPNTVFEVLQVALKKIENWCNRNRLSVNPNKTVVVPFTRMRSMGNFSNRLFLEREYPTLHKLSI
ncbi:hypothetical protein ANN_17277 [Periplaneta americana]|uniref:Reverse transcriptase domain-containing protein n=1 Tax=Periplaneta americana TaxID=6978 RepID=A0ABQ8SSH8_PERAM|nr:hypothetical protein ANN_17277 [Periplaneta americana]